MALLRASAKGVNPQYILSDNGGNFQAANNILHAMWAEHTCGEVRRRRPDITWQFNPPYASHYGGCFERLIGAAKTALYHALPDHFGLSLEQLQTAFAVVEGVLNARPLAAPTAEGGLVPLTPNHFLHGSASHEAVLTHPGFGGTR